MNNQRPASAIEFKQKKFQKNSLYFLINLDYVMHVHMLKRKKYQLGRKTKGTN